MEQLRRLATYVTWPSVDCRYSLIRLANAGFRYSGVADEILCDSCGLTIRDWTQHGDSDPVRQHARRSPPCQLLPPLNAATSSGEPIEAVTTADRPPSLRRRSPAAVTPPSSTWSTELPLAVPAVPPADTGMASRDPETDSRSATNHASLLASGTDSDDGKATGTTLDQTAVVTTGPACEAGRDGCCTAAEPGYCSANMNTGSTSGSNNPDDEEQMLMQENRRLHEAKTCKVCMDNEVNTVFLPCGHLVSCDQCSPKLRNCPVCRAYIRGTVKIVMS